MVGNGQHLECNCLCVNIPVDIQAARFTVDLYVLPNSGATVMLGVQWLQSLGPVLTDYTTLSMQFFHKGRLVELKVDNDANLRQLSSPQFCRLCRTQGNGLCFDNILVYSGSFDEHLCHLKTEFQVLLAN